MNPSQTLAHSRSAPLRNTTEHRASRAVPQVPKYVVRNAAGTPTLRPAIRPRTPRLQGLGTYLMVVTLRVRGGVGWVCPGLVLASRSALPRPTTSHAHRTVRPTSVGHVRAALCSGQQMPMCITGGQPVSLAFWRLRRRRPPYLPGVTPRSRGWISTAVTV